MQDQRNGEVAVADTPMPPSAPQKKKRRKKKKIIKAIIVTAVLLIVAAGIAFGMYKLFHKEKAEKKLLTDHVSKGSIQSIITGSGVTKAKDSAVITLKTGGTVQEVFVKEGDTVKKGDPLYAIDSTEAMAAVDTAQKTVTNYQKQLKALGNTTQYLNVSADFAGILLNTSDIKAGSTVASGTKLATLVDSSKMRLVLYYSYAYQEAIKVGQAAVVSIPSTMNQIPGTVSEINYIKKVTAEGSKLFEVVITMDNPGVLTADMGATASLKGANSEMIFPYEAGKLAWSRSTDIVTKTSGEASVVRLRNYDEVEAGETLLSMKADNNDSEVAAVENQLKTAQDALTKAQDNLKNVNAVSPMTGTVLSCALAPGKEVTSGTVAISIADTSVMTVEAKVDEINISYVKVGMPVVITQYSRNGQQTFNGVVKSVSLEGKFDNGVSFYPAIVEVDNAKNGIMSGMYVDYSMVASQSDNTLLVPVQSVKYTEGGTCLVIKAAEKPEKTIDATKLNFEVPAGYYPVPVTVGLSDSTHAEITGGVTEGTEVFVQYMTNMGNSEMPMGGSGGAVMVQAGG